MWRTSYSPRVGQVVLPPAPSWPTLGAPAPSPSLDEPPLFLANPVVTTTPSQGWPWLLTGALILGGSVLLAKGLRVF